MRQKKTTEEIIGKMRKDIAFKTISADVVDNRTGRPSAATIAFSLSYDGPKPELVQQVAGVLASLYLEENLKVREQQSAGTFKFLEDEAQDLKAQLAAIDTSVSAFKKKNMDALPELLQINLQSLERTERDMDQMNDQLRTLREKESYLQSQLASMPTETDSQDKALLKELKARLVQLESRYSDKYPDVIKTRSEIASLEERLGYPSARSPEKPDNPAYVNLASQLAGAQSEIESVKRQIEEMRRKRDDYRKRVENTPKVDETYKGLMSERNNLQAKYDDLMRKSMEAKVSKGLEKEQMGERFNLIDPARLPEKPVKPNIPAILLIGWCWEWSRGRNGRDPGILGPVDPERQGPGQADVPAGPGQRSGNHHLERPQADALQARRGGFHPGGRADRGRGGVSFLRDGSGCIVGEDFEALRRIRETEDVWEAKA